MYECTRSCLQWWKRSRLKRASLTRGLCHLANVAAATAAALVRGSSGGRRGHRLRGSSRERIGL